MKKTAYLIGLLCFLSVTGHAMAYNISLSPAAQTIEIEGVAAATIDLSVGPAEQLFGFNFNLGFDPGILSFNALIFGPDVSDYLTGFTPPSSGTPGQIAFDGALDLFAQEMLTNGVFNLATVSWSGTAPGTSFLDLNGTVLDFNPEANLVPLNAAAAVTVAPVPEPGIALLLGLGLAGIVGFIKKSRSL
jgi:hypothetical protein